ncbi:MAG: DUF4339 domain-containing protein [Faecalicoccus sp.]|nr:DUF4339 domain-containing protein [Faecalicoccus sp.]
MYCLNCGFEIMEGAKFCSECGTRVPQKEPIVLTNHKEEMEKVIRELKKKVWYYFVDLKPEGPFTEEELTRLFDDGTIKASTEIWHIESDEAIPYIKKDSFVLEKETSEEAESSQDASVEEAFVEEDKPVDQEIVEQMEEVQPDNEDTTVIEIEKTEQPEETEIVTEDIEEDVDQTVQTESEEVSVETVEQSIQIYEDEDSGIVEAEEETPSEEIEEEVSPTYEAEQSTEGDTAIILTETNQDVFEEIELSDEENWEAKSEVLEDNLDLTEEAESEIDHQAIQEEAKWYYVDAANNRQGPVTDTVFHALIDEGIIHEMTYIWTPGMNTWLFLKDSDQYASQTNHQKEPEEAEVFGVDQYWEEEPDSDDYYAATQSEPEKKPVEENWYYVDRMNNRQGPLSTNAIRSLIKEGTIHERTYLWTSGMAGWELMKNTDFYQPEPEASKDWYYIDSAKVRQGKFSDAEMDQFLSQGVITEKTYVWKAGMTQWALLKDTALSRGDKASISQDDDEPWFYRGRDNSRVGPFTASEMEELLSRGTINYQTDVWKRGMSNWKPLSSALRVSKPTHREVEWYVQMHGQTMGPYPESTVIQMLRNNEINGRTYVWSAGMQDWQQLKNTSIPKSK